MGLRRLTKMPMLEGIVKFGEVKHMGGERKKKGGEGGQKNVKGTYLRNPKKEKGWRSGGVEGHGGKVPSCPKWGFDRFKESLEVGTKKKGGSLQVIYLTGPRKNWSKKRGEKRKWKGGNEGSKYYAVAAALRATRKRNQFATKYGKKKKECGALGNSNYRGKKNPGQGNVFLPEAQWLWRKNTKKKGSKNLQMCRHAGDPERGKGAPRSTIILLIFGGGLDREKL